MFDTKLKKALKRVLREPASASESIKAAAQERVTSVGEAELLCQVLKLFPLPPNADADEIASSRLHRVVGLMQGVENEKAHAVLKRFGAPELLRIFDVELARAAKPDGSHRIKGDLSFLLKVLCLYAPEGGLSRLCLGARSVLLRDTYLWSVTLSIVANGGHPWQSQLVEQLRDPLPEGFAGVAYLDLANALARADKLPRHPFASEAGVALICQWLSARDPDVYSYAHSATAALPFLDPPARANVQRLALEHPDRRVQLEAAWAMASLGDETGVSRLQAACADPRDANLAVRYLEELGASDRVPVQTRSVGFKAMAEMCEWLAHPQEFGRPPEVIEQVDARELYWPPTNDRRGVWLFRYEYPPRDDSAERDIGFGMVGSETFALFGEATAERTPIEVYALHCAWELECNQDPRAPEERSVASGLAILRQHNPSL